jgi:hypothetical protein
LNTDSDTEKNSDSDTGSDDPSTALLPPSIAPQTNYCPFNNGENLDMFDGKKVVRVCPDGDNREGCHVNTISEAISLAQNGDRIEIVGDGADYAQCAVIPDTMSNVEIAGVCGRPHILDTVCQSKGVFLNLGKDITLTNLEVSGAQITLGEGGNAAAVRDQGLGNLNLRYVYFHDNQNGILGGMGVIHIDWSKFEANGSQLDPGYTHNTYFSADVTEVIIENSLFLRARHEGNNMKSRAQKMVFRCSVSASLDGDDSREMDISEGGELIIENSIIQQGSASVNSGMIGFATESENPDKRHTTQILSITSTDLINDKQTGTFIALNAYDTDIKIKDVRYIGAGSTLVYTNSGAYTISETNTENIPTRAEAGLPAQSNDHTELPLPPGCPDFEYF